MTPKTKIGQYFFPHKGYPGVHYTHNVYDYNSLPEYARELFKPSKDA